MDDSPEVCASRGAELLDYYYCGWQWGVDIDKFDMFMVSKCMLGQLFGTTVRSNLYITGLKYLSFTHEQAVYYGFARAKRSEYEALTKAWIAEIKKRPRPLWVST